ncbi:MAG: prepilin-type N-terminal cleavage/methylation domain-containing protein [Dehalococcoidales bacterium]|nr:prepilin-type N-terminal cleavage/methylation domain-containing protein [Dehalococcoidales bacterium]
MKKLFRNQKGFSLIEVLISIALIGIIGVTFLGALGTAPKTVISTDERQTAKVIAEAQMEYIKSLASAVAYVPLTIPDEYPGYSVATDEEGKIIPDIVREDGKIQKITIIVQRGEKSIYTLVGYKAR